MSIVLRALQARPRLVAGVVCGLVAAALLRGFFRPLMGAIVAWNIGCIVFLILSAKMFSQLRSRDIAADAEAQEEGEWTIFWLTIGAVTASFGAIVGEFSAVKDSPPAVRDLHVALVAVTLLVSWLMTHTLFAFRYAHEYYEMDESGHIAGGLQFPGEERPDYWDFFYFALVLGMTFQVSDVQITSRKLRRLAAAHGLLGFLFNAVIIALTVNIAAGLL
jgi:uncharacterized membrane protein